MVICLPITSHKAQRSVLVSFLEDWVSPIQNDAELFKTTVRTGSKHKRSS